MLNLREERELARASVKYILTDMSDIRRSFIRLGFHLYEFERMHYYEDFGYTSIVEFAEKNLGLSKTQVSIKIYILSLETMMDIQHFLRCILQISIKNTVIRS